MPIGRMPKQTMTGNCGRSSPQINIGSVDLLALALSLSLDRMIGMMSTRTMISQSN
jgi:hypothetical protein